MQRTLLLFCSFALLAAAIGCDAGGSVVQGKVQFADGSPLTAGELIFDDGKYSEIAPIDAEGKFKVFKAMPDGTYKVTIQGATEGDYTSPKSLIDKRYTEYGTTDLELTVKGSASDVVLTVDRPKSR